MLNQYDSEKKVEEKKLTDLPESDGKRTFNNNDDALQEEEDTDDEKEEENSPRFTILVDQNVLSDKHFERIGFAFGRSKNPEETLLEFKDKVNIEFNENLNSILSYYDKKLANIQEKIDRKYIEIENCDKDLALISTELLQLSEKVNELKHKVFESKETLKDSVLKIGDRKKNIITDRIATLYSELRELSTSYKDIVEKKYDNSNGYFEKIKDSFSKRITLLNKFDENYEKIYQTINEKIFILYQTGISDASYKILVAIGYTASIVAGWFYSIYSLQTNMNSDSVLFFFISNIFNFSSIFIGNSSIAFNRGVILFLGFLLLYLFVTGIIYLCEMALNKFINTDIEKETEDVVNNSIALNVKDQNNVTLATSIQTKSIFKTWIFILPYLIFGTLFFIILSVGRSMGSPNDINNLDASLSGHFAGSTIALAISAISYLYLSKVIEPRLIKKEDSKISIQYNFELAFVLILFIIGVFIGIFLLNESNNIVSRGYYTLAEFGIITFVTSFSLGYGWYYGSLISERNSAEQKLMKIDQAVKESSSPTHLYFIEPEMQLFSARYISLMNQVLELMALRNAVIRGLFEEGVRKPFISNGDGEKQLTPIAKFFSLFTKKIEDKKEESDIIQYNTKMSLEDKALFPDLDAEFQHNQSEFQKNAQELNQLLEDIENIKAGTHLRQNTINKRKGAFLRKQGSYKAKYEKTLKTKSYHLKSLRDNYDQSTSRLEYGFRIGIWWESSPLNPKNQ